jgi:hypothetical protein
MKDEKKTEKQQVNPCPLPDCPGPVQRYNSFIKCEYCGLTAPDATWPDIPRRDERAVTIAREMKAAADLGDVALFHAGDRKRVRDWASRVESIAEPQETPEKQQDTRRRREACQRLIAELGSIGPENLESAVTRALDTINRARNSRFKAIRETESLRRERDNWQICAQDWQERNQELRPKIRFLSNQLKEAERDCEECERYIQDVSCESCRDTGWIHDRDGGAECTCKIGDALEDSHYQIKRLDKRVIKAEAEVTRLKAFMKEHSVNYKKSCFSQCGGGCALSAIIHKFLEMNNV